LIIQKTLRVLKFTIKAYNNKSSRKKKNVKTPSLIGCRGNIANRDEEKAEVLHAFFTSVFNSQTRYSQCTQPPVLEDREGEQNKPPIIQEEAVKDLLCHLDTYKSMGPNGIHPRVLRELQRSWPSHSPVSSPG